jgi:hypothetical protein
LQGKGVKSKDVRARKNGSRVRPTEKTTDSLPKILRLAAHSGSLQGQRVRCGKANCKCARGQLHEGYYYFFLWTGAGLLKLYVRRKDVPTVRAVIAERRRRQRAWRAELNEARAILLRMRSSAGEWVYEQTGI